VSAPVASPEFHLCCMFTIRAARLDEAGTLACLDHLI
jgi:hypothetical protein